MQLKKTLVNVEKCSITQFWLSLTAVSISAITSLQV